jgi:hypothetical protein
MSTTTGSPTTMTTSMTSPTTETSTYPSTMVTTTVEKFAPFRYQFKSPFNSYRDIESPHVNDYNCGWEREHQKYIDPNLYNGSNYAPYYGTTAQYRGYELTPFPRRDKYTQRSEECSSIFFSSWLLYILCIVASLYFLLF